MKNYNGAADGYDEGNGVAIAADGSVYVTGTTRLPDRLAICSC